MYTIKLDIPDDNEYMLLLKLLQRLGIKTKPGDREEMNGSGKKMADALKKLAKAGGIHNIENPAEWERQNRKDRNLP